jgi:general secretion pathway protein A
LFSREAVALVHEHSGGIPRVINVVCDNALINGMALERQPVDRAIVLEVCRDFALRQTESRSRDDASDATPAAVLPPQNVPAGEVGEGGEREVYDQSVKPRRLTLFGMGRRQ